MLKRSMLMLSLMGLAGCGSDRASQLPSEPHDGAAQRELAGKDALFAASGTQKPPALLGQSITVARLPGTTSLGPGGSTDIALTSFTLNANQQAHIRAFGYMSFPSASVAQATGATFAVVCPGTNQINNNSEFMLTQTGQFTLNAEQPFEAVTTMSNQTTQAMNVSCVLRVTVFASTGSTPIQIGETPGTTPMRVEVTIINS